MANEARETRRARRSLPIRKVRVPVSRRDSTAHDRRANEVLGQFRLVYGSVRRHFRSLERACGVSASQAWILRELERTPDLGLSELASRLSIHTSTASQLVEKLVRAGCVLKLRSARDQRRIGLRLSQKGMAVMRNAPQPAEGVLPRALRGLSDARLRSLQSSLAELLDRLGTQDDRDAATLLADM